MFRNYRSVIADISLVSQGSTLRSEQVDELIIKPVLHKEIDPSLKGICHWWLKAWKSFYFNHAWSVVKEENYIIVNQFSSLLFNV